MSNEPTSGGTYPSQQLFQHGPQDPSIVSVSGINGLLCVHSSCTKIAYPCESHSEQSSQPSIDSLKLLLLELSVLGELPMDKLLLDELLPSSGGSDCDDSDGGAIHTVKSRKSNITSIEWGTPAVGLF